MFDRNQEIQGFIADIRSFFAEEGERLFAKEQELSERGYPPVETQAYMVEMRYFTYFTNAYNDRVNAYSDKMRQQLIERTAAALRGEKI